MSVLRPYLTSALAHIGLSPSTPKPDPHPVDLTTSDPAKNLAILERYLLSLPADYADFDMHEFVRSADLSQLAVYGKQNGSVQSCGTAACAVGHGPAAHLFMNDHEIALINNDSDDEAWWAYVERVFGTRVSSPAFEWMFGGGWVHVDNTVHGAAKRIRYYLEHGVPAGFHYAHTGYRYADLYQA